MNELNNTTNKPFVLMEDFNYCYDRWPPLQSQGISMDASNFGACESCRHLEKCIALSDVYE